MEKIQLSEKWIVTLLLFKDLLIHVRDVSHPETENQKMNVLNVLKNLEVPDRLMSSIIEVHNKTDLIQEYGENAPTQYCAKVLGMCRICWNINKIYVYFVSRCTHVFVCVYIYISIYSIFYLKTSRFLTFSKRSQPLILEFGLVSQIVLDFLSFPSCVQLSVHWLLSTSCLCSVGAWPGDTEDGGGGWGGEFGEKSLVEYSRGSQHSTVKVWNSWLAAEFLCLSSITFLTSVVFLQLAVQRGRCPRRSGQRRHWHGRR